MGAIRQPILGTRSITEYRTALARPRPIAQGLRFRADEERRSAEWRQIRARAAKLHSTATRVEFQRRLDSLPITEQLKQLAIDDTYPVEFYPTHLAYGATDDILSHIDHHFRFGLLLKLKGNLMGPWAIFKRRLLRTFDRER